MSRVAQAPAVPDTGPSSPFLSRFFILLVACSFLGACVSGGVEATKPGIDASIQTGYLGETSPASGFDHTTDLATIRDAVSAADIKGLKGGSLPWANSETGARGTITGLAEASVSGMPCRKFTTTRENFDGISLYAGEVCRVGPGAWRMENFASL